MENGGGDALAHSQLARLYKLGLLQQDAGEVENDPHAFLNRLPPASARLASPNERAGLRTSSLQSSGDHSSDGSKDSASHSPFTRVGPYPLASMMDMTRPPPRFEMTSRAPLSPLSVASRPTLPPRFDAAFPSYKPPVNATQATEAMQLTRQWFSAWKRCVEAKWLREKADDVGSRHLKRRMLGRWQDAVYKTHLNDARCRQLMSWKAQRALQLWRQWAALHGRVTWFLTAQGRSHALLNRLRRERAWVRWKRFVTQSHRQRKKTNKALEWRRQRCVRQAWLQWRVEAFGGRRRRRAYRAFLVALREEQEARSRRWAVAMELYDSHAQDRLRRLVRRWRVFNIQRQREHQRTWQVRMILTRGKFFTVWQTTTRQTQLLAKLRRRVQRRVWRDHLKAWWAATRASELGRTSTLWHPEAICARYLHVWKCWTLEKLRFRFATSMVHRKQKKKALRVMRAWTTEHARYSRLCKAADAITRRRILTRVWESGLLAFHFARKHEKQLVGQVRTMSLATAMQRWRLEWLMRHAWRTKKQQARKMAFQSVVKGVWHGWRLHTQWRRHHKQQQARAAQHDHQRRLLRGLVELSKVVDQKSEWTKACRLVRIRQRQAWKRRVLLTWRAYTRKERLLDEKRGLFVGRQAYATSIWNPLWRRWRRWVVFTHFKIQERQCIFHFQLRRKRKAFEAWKRRAVVIAKQHEHTKRHEKRCLLSSFETWRLFIDTATVKRNQQGVAASFHRQKCCVKALRAWNRLVSLRYRTRQRSDSVRTIRRHRDKELWFSIWRRSFILKRGIATIECRRRHAWLEFCWDAWLHHHHAVAKRKKKLTYFHRVFGLHPSTSPVKRLWCCWKEWTRQRVTVKQYQYRCKLRQAGICLDAWKTFSLAKRGLRQWHRLSLIAGATHSDLGKRCRLLRERRHESLLKAMFHAWVDASKARQRRYEVLLEARQRILDEIPDRQAARTKYRRCRLRLWFQRWRRRQLASIHLAMHLHRIKSIRTAFLGWWRQLVHGKQERLLEGARRSMGSLSINRTKQTTAGKEANGLKKVSFTDQRNVKATTAARMVDPLPVRRVYSQPSQRLPPKQTLRKKTSREQRAETTRQAQESVERYRKSTRSSSLTKSHSQSSERRPTKVLVDELPLFDQEETVSMAPPSNRPEVLTPPPPPPLVVGQSDGGFTLESLASMDLYSPPSESRKLARESTDTTRVQPTESPSREILASIHTPAGTKRTRGHEPTLFAPSQSLVPQANVASRKRIEKPISNRTPTAKASNDLVQLLEIPPQQHNRPASTFRAVIQGMRTDSQSHEPTELDVLNIVREILDYYVVKSQHTAAVLPVNQPDTWLQTWGFCLFRDLGLFENGHFLSALERTIHVVTSGAVSHEPRVALQLLLEGFLDDHPHRKSSTQADPLSWLVKRHLVRRCGLAALSQSKSTALGPFWIRSELPDDVVRSLPKLVKCFLKYQKPLEQFFLWRPENSGVLPSKAHCRMDLGTFLLLMKHCNVHPQLFDRRELEEAVASAGVSMTSRGQDTGMNLPQFIEALVRCALRLQWMEAGSSSGRNAENFPDLVVAIKFLMLVFTMEGRGSMLTKRSQDLDVLMSFLQKQQHETSAEKLRRFQGLLRAEPPRVNEDKRSRPPAVQGTNVFRSFMDTQPVAYEIPQTDGEPPTTLDGHDREAGHHHEPDDFRGSTSVRDEYECRPSRRSINESEGQERGQRHRESDIPSETKNLSPVTHVGFRASVHGAQEELQRGYEQVRTQPHTAEHHEQDKMHSIAVCAGPVHEVTRSSPSPTPNLQEGPVTHSSFEQNGASGLQQPMDREAFLNEILSSITDVELLLQQADDRRTTNRTTSSSYTDNSPDTLVELSSEPFSVAYPERYALLATGQLPDSSLDGDSGVLAEDVRVGDPVLDYLTFADRFSESPDWESHLTIADVAEHGIHAVFPSSMNVLGQIRSRELDDLTRPQPATAHLRANDDNEVDSRSQLLPWSSEREWLNALHDTGDAASR